MCIFLYSFCFSLHYKCQFGQFLVLIGNTEELGAWDVSKGIELQWNEVFYNFLYFFRNLITFQGHIWRKYISLKQKNDVILQYKYLVCRRVKGKIEAVRWEEGPNRYLNLKQLKKLFVSIGKVFCFFIFKLVFMGLQNFPFTKGKFYFSKTFLLNFFS